MLNKKATFTFIGLLLSTYLIAQDAVHNFGTIRLHDDARVGFHMDLTNDGIFYDNSGLVGFYNSQVPLTVSGTSIPAFYDTEIMVDNHLYLDIGIAVINNANFISGDVITPRTDVFTYLNFVNDAFYTGTADSRKVDGYAGITNKESFIFPIGDQNRVRPLTITSLAINPVASTAYFFEDPGVASTFPTSYDTSIKANMDLSVSTVEFWDLEGTIPSNVTLSWDSSSNTSGYVDDLSNIRVMGWSKVLDLWVDLGNTDQTGDFTNGTVTSGVFVPNDYDVITLGGNINDTPGDVLDLGNYILSPNGDGLNDTLIIEGLELSPNNTMRIYNRYGILVYERENYDNSFDGTANVSMVIKQPDGLAAGVYFYIIDLQDLKEAHQGYLYIFN